MKKLSQALSLWLVTWYLRCDREREFKEKGNLPVVIWMTVGVVGKRNTGMATQASNGKWDTTNLQHRREKFQRRIIFVVLHGIITNAKELVHRILTFVHVRRLNTGPGVDRNHLQTRVKVGRAQRLLFSPQPLEALKEIDDNLADGRRRRRVCGGPGDRSKIVFQIRPCHQSLEHGLGQHVYF